MKTVHLCLMTASICLAFGSVAAAEDLTFLQVTDLHVPHAIAQTQETIAALPDGPVELTPWAVTVPAPSFVLATGDLNEFGGGRGWWQQYMDLWQDISLPVYHQLGNHDNTWRCARPSLRELHGGAFYAFERAGVKFIGWDTATPQDPRPSVAEECAQWLADEFTRTPPEQPVIVFAHHALDGREFAGSYDRARLLDLLRTRNVVVMLIGHGHNARAWQVEGIDTVMGGSTFGNRPGFSIISISSGMLRVAHQYVGENAEMIPLLEKQIPSRSPFLQMEVAPADGAVLASDAPLRWTVGADGDVQEGRWTLDDDLSGEMAPLADGWCADLEPASVSPGAHTLRLELTASDGRGASRSVSFYRNGGTFDIVWRCHLPGSCQGAPLAVGDRIFVGDNSGALSVIDTTDGFVVARVETGGEVRSAPVATPDGDTIVFGSADGIVRAIDRDGSELWRHDAGSAIYGGPLVGDGRMFIGTADGDVFAVDAATGTLIWHSDAPEYSIERTPAIGDGAVFAGSWDTKAYAFDAATGELRWSGPSAGSDREGFVAWYYSPADSPPAFAGGHVFFADRAYRLTIFDAQTGERLLAEEKCVAVAPSADGAFVYVRHTDGRVGKRSPDGSVLWTAEVPTGAVATAPIESHGLVWVISDRGTLSALDAQTGAVLGQQQVTRGLFAFAAPAFDGERVYVADMAGNVTCLAPEWPGT